MARKILLADDSVTAQNMGRKILADAGYEVITVNNGSAALKKIAEAKPDLIVLDVYMPGYSGLEVCQRLKEAQETSRIPVLLTVGKLEPFKPEEAKRVRAEGYIVKPFEASELLAALTKLEDKIVPRAEPSKPGRFARANAAIDESRTYDKSVAGEEDSGWKNRISFPSKKKKASEESEAEDPAIYNAVNKDLRTVVESKITGPVEPYEQQKVDLGALAPEGLPKDVTPEEIAALAAAAAQVKGKLAEEFNPPASPAEAPTAEFKPEIPAAEIKAPEVRVEEAAKAPEAVAEVKAEPAPEASFAVQKSEADQLAASLAATMPAEVAAAIAGLDSEPSKPVDISSSPSHHAAEEPVTMAVAAGAGASGGSSRWTAVSVALAGDEAATSLEQEMHKAHAAFAAAENARAGSVVVLPERPAAPKPPAQETSSSGVAEPPPSVQESQVPALSAEAIAAAETMRAVVRQFETVSARHEPPVEPAPVPVSEIVAATETPTASESKAAENFSAEPIAAPSAYETPAEAVSDIPRVASFETPAAELAAVPAEQPKEAEKTEEPKFEAPKHEEPKYEEPTPVAAAVALQVEEPQSVSAAQPESSTASANQISAEPVPSEPSPSSESEAASPAATDEHKPEKDTEIHDTTAAAWASWRRIRESGDRSGEKPGSDPETRDLAAMAVAAGAEKAPEDTSNSEDGGDIANIVDSVLADLRPKIVAEISKKMGKKK